MTTAPFYQSTPLQWVFLYSIYIFLQLILPSYWKQPLANTNQLETSLFLSWPWPVSRPVQLVFSNPQQSLFGVSGQFGWRTYCFVSVFHLNRHCAEHPVPYYGFHITKIPVSNNYNSDLLFLHSITLDLTQGYLFLLRSSRTYLFHYHTRYVASLYAVKSVSDFHFLSLLATLYLLALMLNIKKRQALRGNLMLRLEQSLGSQR